MIRVLILSGPNLNLLGTREPEIYGYDTLADIERMCRDRAEIYGWIVDFRQSNHEGELVTWIQESIGEIDGLIVNAAAYTHTSIALHDALKMLGDTPIIEVHISDPEKRESFRHTSYITPVAAEVIKGYGSKGYVMALERLSVLFAGG
ncbi:MAG: type II 3-dehydroquinate dehydratase [Alphaproteobacteria bacterium]|nr:type II 3-dehydroquinate dehydratase [Alphaproteobacteria bacterium]